MLSSEVWCSRVLCASTWGNTDRGARRVSSWEIRMELIRIALRTPCHPGEGPYTLHTQTVLLAQHSSVHLGRNSVRRHFISGIPCVDILHPDISQLDGRERRFNFSGQTYPDLLIALTRRVFSQYTVPRCSPEASWYFRPTFWDILGYFVLDIWCLNPQTLLVIHLS